jgi:ribonuclease P protein component
MAEAGRPARSRLSRSAEFDRVYRQGRSAQHRLLVLYRFQRPEDTPNPDPEGPASRIGVTVSKKIGNAVVRNRLKRQLRAVLVEAEQLDGACDYVAIAKPGLAELAERDHEEFAVIVGDLVERLSSTSATER